jgi:hypothetical protein
MPPDVAPSFQASSSLNLFALPNEGNASIERGIPKHSKAS